MRQVLGLQLFFRLIGRSNQSYMYVYILSFMLLSSLRYISSWISFHSFSSRSSFMSMNLQLSNGSVPKIRNSGTFHYNISYIDWTWLDYHYSDIT